MAGTKDGGLAAAATNKRLYGEDFYKKMGRRGGQWRGRKGFASMTYEKRVAAGAKGGTISRRRPSDGA